MQSNLRRFSRGSKELKARIEKIQTILNDKVGPAAVEKFYGAVLNEETLQEIYGFAMDRLQAETLDLEGVAIRVRFVKIPGRSVHSMVEIAAHPKC